MIIYNLSCGSLYENLLVRKFVIFTSRQTDGSDDFRSIFPLLLFADYLVATDTMREQISRCFEIPYLKSFKGVVYSIPPENRSK